MDYTRANDKKLEIILDTYNNKLLLGDKSISILQPYKIKIRTIDEYETLIIEFDAIQHAEYATSLHKELTECIEQKLDDKMKLRKPDLKVRQYTNATTKRPGLMFSMSIQKYDFRVI